MNIDQSDINAFLLELYNQTGGDPESQASMHDVAGAVGLEDNKVDQMAESLYIQELAEMKTLSGGMGITVKGIKQLNLKPSGAAAFYSLPKAPVLDENDKKSIQDIVRSIKAKPFKTQPGHDFLEQYVLDLKCVEFQLSSPNPRTSVMRQLFVSLKEGSGQQLTDDNAAVIDALIE